MKTEHYDELAAGEFDGYFSIDNLVDGIAWRVVGWETSPIAVWSCECGAYGYERDSGGGKTCQDHDFDCACDDVSWNEEPEFERTGNVLAVMVGDDRYHSVNPSDLTMLKRSAFCGECGQVGCHCDGYPQDDE